MPATGLVGSKSAPERICSETLAIRDFQSSNYDGECRTEGAEFQEKHTNVTLSYLTFDFADDE